MRSIEDALKSRYPDLTPNEIELRKQEVKTCIFVLCAIFFGLSLIVCSAVYSAHKIQVSVLKVGSMDFTVELNNNSITNQSHYLPLASARWDLFIRVPGKLFGYFICLQGNLQATILYKNVTLVTSSLQRLVIII